MTRHSLLYFLARSGVGLLVAATVALLTRLLSPEEYGQYALAVTSATVASTLLFQWLVVAVGRHYPAHALDPGPLLAAANRAFAWATGFAALATIVVVLAARSLDWRMAAAALVAALALARYNLLLQIANVQGRPRIYAALSWTKSLTALLASAGLVLSGAGALGAVAGFAGGHLAAYLLFRDRGAAGRARGSDDQLRPLVNYGMPLVFTFVGSLAVDFADRYLIGAFIGIASVGPYSAASELVQQTIGAITNVLFLAGFPRAVQVFESEGPDRAARSLSQLGGALLLVGMPAATGFGVLAPDLAATFFGPAFRLEAARVIPVLSAAAWLSGFKNYYLDTPFQLRKTTRYQAAIAGVMVISSVALNALLIAQLGTLGSAIAALASVGVGAALSQVLGSRQLPLPPIAGRFLRAMVASATMAGVLLALPDGASVVWLAPKVLLGVTVYGLSALALDVEGVRAWVASRIEGMSRP